MESKTKLKHNKKRNTAFLYETLIKELAKSVVYSNKEHQKLVSSIIKEHFKKRSILDQELSLYKQVYETKEYPKEVAEKLINTVKAEHSRLDQKAIFEEQSKLISKINHLVGTDAYDNFVPNYKTLATISQIFNRSTEPRKRILLEQELIESVSSKQPEKKMVLERTDSLVLKRFIERFNESYEGKLLKEQKQLLSKFVSHNPDSIELKVFLNEEVHRIKEKLKDLSTSSFLKENETLAANVKQTIAYLQNLKIDRVDEGLVEKIMYLQEFVGEVSE
jgi:hypothetical protein